MHEQSLLPDDDQQRDTGGLKRLGLGVAVVALVAAGVGVAMRLHATSGLHGVAAEAALPNVSVVIPRNADGDDELVLPGNLQAYNAAAINARTSGYVKRWLADIGDTVRQGQALAVLEAPDLDQQLIQAQADYQTALANQHLSETTNTRWKSLLAKDAVSQQEADEKKGDLAAKLALSHSALANVKRLQATQGFKTLYAPFDGVVTSRAAQIGALVVSGNIATQPLFTVSDMHRMRIDVRVPQAYSAMLHKGVNATLQLPEYPGRKFTATLTRSANAVDQGSGAVLVQLEADNTDHALKPGAYAQVHFQLGDKASGTPEVAVPGSAILYGAAGPQVAVVDGQGVVTMHSVTIARDKGSIVLLSGGVSATDHVIDSPPDAVRTGDHVRVAQTTPMPAPKPDETAKPNAQAPANTPAKGAAHGG
ncbi:efflux RND transporter periplasmic adaptor subunit [Novosphingobium rosa]|uniref:efflux RND transporter periplasmic adaptor subunit n=1 Tax=Novosphingobium rosa TaxID=76978 RepID=UPI000A04A52C|nr:efflux RND transporter periplasmic adaptor subunit [Novosphingobium rosa]